MSDDLPNQNNNYAWGSTPPTQPPETNEHHSYQSHISAPIHVSEETKYSENNDPPLVDVKVTNPVTYLKKWLTKLLNNEGVDIHITIKPITIFLSLVILSATYGIGYNLGLNQAAKVFFPVSSPILHRSVEYQGIVQKSDSGEYYLSLEDNSLWVLKPSSSKIKLESFLGEQVTVKGNLTSEQKIIEVTDVISSSNYSLPSPAYSTALAPLNSAAASSSASLPILYSGLTWEKTQTKTLTFTSGKRRIEQEGVYLESSPITDYPQDFINYYLSQLNQANFKQTLNSADSSGITITYSKDDLFLTFGVNNIYTGSSDSKKLTGYKAFLEHN